MASSTIWCIILSPILYLLWTCHHHLQNHNNGLTYQWALVPRIHQHLKVWFVSINTDILITVTHFNDDNHNINQQQQAK